MKILSVNVGFITNSSSAIFWFPRDVLNDPDVVALMQRYGVAAGFVGDDLWDRGHCDSVLLTAEQRATANASLVREDGVYGPGGWDPNDENVVVIYGDEHEGLAQLIGDAMEAAAERLNLDVRRDEYN